MFTQFSPFFAETEKMRQLEKIILALIGNRKWKLKTLDKVLIEKGINTFKEEGSLAKFLKKRPGLFCIKDKYVWNLVYLKKSSLEQEIFTETEKMSQLEKNILALIGKNKWKIETLEKTLIEKGINTFKPKGTLSNFLTKRPRLFCMKDNYVWNLLALNPIGGNNRNDVVRIKIFEG